jgi:MFS family permease
MVGMGFVQNFHGLLIARIFLGITEAGLFPGVSFFLTQWYRRYEINFRIAMFFSAATAAGAFGGLLARLINEMDGVSGYEGWRWSVKNPYVSLKPKC